MGIARLPEWTTRYTFRFALRGVGWESFARLPSRDWRMCGRRWDDRCQGRGRPLGLTAGGQRYGSDAVLAGMGWAMPAASVEG
jgi:hypothetical protein